MNKQIIGIVTGGEVREIFVKGKPDPVRIKTSLSHVIFIRAALDKLNVDLLPAGQPNAGAAMVVPGRAIERDHRGAVDWSAFEAARAGIDRSPYGSRLAALCRRHFEEVRQLVHHRRRVMVTWQRSRGPGFIAAIARASALPEWPICSEIDGVRLLDALRALRNVLMAEGSPGLRAAIREHEAEVFSLAERATSVEALLAALSERDGAAHEA